MHTRSRSSKQRSTFCSVGLTCGCELCEELLLIHAVSRLDMLLQWQEGVQMPAGTVPCAWTVMHDGNA